MLRVHTSFPKPGHLATQAPQLPPLLKKIKTAVTIFDENSILFQCHREYHNINEKFEK